MVSPRMSLVGIEYSAVANNFTLGSAFLVGGTSAVVYQSVWEATYDSPVYVSISTAVLVDPSRMRPSITSSPYIYEKMC